MAKWYAVKNKRFICGVKTLSYWLCFGFDDIHPDELHCTAKYLGDLTPGSVAIVHVILEQYFRKNGFKGLNPVFQKEEMFGPNKDVRVLTPTDRVGDHNYLMDLFNRLDRIYQDKWPVYSPHVTTDRPIITMPLTRYCFMNDDKIIREWKV